MTRVLLLVPAAIAVVAWTTSCNSERAPDPREEGHRREPIQPAAGSTDESEAGARQAWLTDLQPFEREVSLQIDARWRKDKCLDVVTVTNLPSGVMFTIHGGMDGAAHGAISLPKGEISVVSDSEKMLHEKVLCDPDIGAYRCSKDALVHLKVGGPSWLAEQRSLEVTDPLLARQAERLGAHGERLRGPGTSTLTIGGSEERIAWSGFQKVQPCE